MEMFKKVIALTTAAVMLMSCSAFVAAMSVVEDETVMTDDTATVVIDCGIAKAGKMMTVAIYEPVSNGAEDLTDGSASIDDATLVNAAISYAGQHRADANGKITITYQPKGPKGKYQIRLGSEGSFSQEVLEFDYLSASDPQNIVDTLKLAPTVENVADIFVKNECERVYTDFQILDIDDEALYADYDVAAEETQTKVHEYIAGKMSTVNTAADFVALFNEAAYVEILNAKTGDDLLAFIDTYKDYSGIATADAYVKIREDAELFTAAVKSAAITDIEATAISGMTKADATKVVSNAILNAVLSTTSAYGALGDLIVEFNADIIAADGDYAAYDANTAKLGIARDLVFAQPFANFAAFITKFNGLVGSPSTPTTPSAPGGIVVDTPSTPLGNGGSSGDFGSGTGTGIVRPVPDSSNIFTDDNTAAPSTPATAVFTDLGNHAWAEQAIKTLKEKNIVNGKTATEFKPEDTVLREEFAKMIMLTVLSASVESSTETAFADVDANAWYAPYIAAATKQGVINGFSDTQFGIGNTIRREDMAVMCYRAIKAAGITLEPVREAAKFEDAISDYAQEAISEMYAAGLINGYSETSFNAGGTATRAEAAMILYNVVQKYGK